MRIDSHCHIDRYPDPGTLVEECDLAQLFTVAVTNLPSHFELARPHLRSSSHVRPALGFHPLLAAEHFRQVERFRDLLPQARYVGEIGLDFSREGVATKERQVEAFSQILDALRGHSKFVTIHSRGAESTVLDMLVERDTGPVVFHWFSGPAKVLEEAVRQGHYFSVNPAMISSATGRALIKRIPQDRILTETDGPHVKVGRRSAYPQDVDSVLCHLAEIWRVERRVAEEQVFASFNKLSAEPVVG